jgi:hypothetical protein
LNPSCLGSSRIRRPNVSHQRMLGAAIRWVRSMTGRRARSYPASAPGTVSASASAAASAIESSMAILVPEPMDGCAVCAASPSSTRFRYDQLRLRTTRKLVHFVLFTSSGPPPSRSRNTSAISFCE